METDQTARRLCGRCGKELELKMMDYVTEDTQRLVSRLGRGIITDYPDKARETVALYEEENYEYYVYENAGYPGEDGQE